MARDYPVGAGLRQAFGWWWGEGSEEEFGELEDALFPGHAVGDAVFALEGGEVFDVPVVVSDEGLFIGIARFEIEEFLSFFD